MHTNSALTLRIFNPEPAPKTNAATIGDLFESVVIAELSRLNRAPATISDYRTSVTKWELFWETGASQPPDGVSGGQPAAAVVTRRDLQAFADWYRSTGIAATTVNRRVGLLTAILNAADDDDRYSIDPPKAPRRLPSQANTAKVVLPDQHVEAIYNACEIATWPEYDCDRKPLPAAAADYWRCLIVLLWNYGPRLQDFVAYETGRRPLCWGGETSGVSFETESPASEAQSAHGWLWFVPTKTHAIKAQALVLPLPLVACEHLRMVRGSGSGFVFPFPRNKKHFAEQRRAIFEAANVSPKPAISKGRTEYLPKDFRKTCLSNHQRVRRGIGPFVTGHADRSSASVTVADRHYDNAELALAEHFQTFPQLAAFSKPIKPIKED